MPKKLRITTVPPGPAPRAIREAWVGIEIPIDEAALARLRSTSGKPSPPPGNRHEVTVVDAVLALREAGRSIEASYWLGIATDTIGFRKDVCELIEA